MCLCYMYRWERSCWKKISRRNLVRFSALGAGATAAIAAGAPAQTALASNLPQGNAYPNQLKNVHLSDTHFFSKGLWSDCPDFTLAENSDRKMFKESGAIIDKALAETVAFKASCMPDPTVMGEHDPED